MLSSLIFAALCGITLAAPQNDAPFANSSSTCTVTEYSKLAAAVANCTDIVLQDLYAPGNSSIDMKKLKAGSTVTFAGTTTFGFTNDSNFDPITISGQNITVLGAPGHVIDGNGSLYWDGLGSNGGVPKPNHFIVLSKLTKGSIVKDLNIQNWPVHCFSITGCSDLAMTNILLNNTSGFAPNNRSNGLDAAHNSDGFDLSSCNRVTLDKSTVINQDDCVAITSGDSMTVSEMTCIGGHGLSIGSVGGKSNNNVSNIVFRDSYIGQSENGARIKSNFNTTGFISNITYENIVLDGITRYGIDLQQDYLNGGPTGIPSNGVKVDNIVFKNVTGSMADSNKTTPYYVLCGQGSCTGVVFENVNVTGGDTKSSCNQPAEGCPA